MATRIAVRHLFKVFGNRPERALDLLRQGRTKAQIFAETGLGVGVDDATFDIKAGEIFVIMGLSGSGKSTLVRLFNRLIEPTGGAIEIDGRDITKFNRRDLIELRRREMSMVFQSFALLPHLTVWENAAFGLDVAGVDRRTRRERAQAALEAVGLGPYAESRPASLSGGMQQRVGLARALANEPSILLMDEAFSALDPLIRAEMQDELLRLQESRQRTIVFISHDLDEAFRIGDRIAIMESGRIVQVGRPDEILKQPADAYVRSFFKGFDVSKVLTAADVARHAQVTVVRHPGEGVRATIHRLRQFDREFAYVQDAKRRFQGVVSIDSLKSVLDRSNGDAGLPDALLPEVEPLPSDLPVEALLGRVASSPFPLPVVDPAGFYIGAVSKTALLETLDRTR